MKIRMNRAMRAALDQYGIPEISELKVDVGSTFQEILSAGVVTNEDCLLIASNLSTCKGVQVKDFPDLTGYECYINKINVDDYFPSADPKELLQSSFALMGLLEGQLAKFGKKVEIIMGFQVDDVATSAVRFHRVRGSESWLNSDLEKYEECILVAEVN